MGVEKNEINDWRERIVSLLLVRKVHVGQNGGAFMQQEKDLLYEIIRKVVRKSTTREDDGIEE